MTVSKEHLAGPILVTAIDILGEDGPSWPFSLSAPGLKVGDRVTSVFLHYALPGPSFAVDIPGSVVEAVISVADQIQQLGGNLGRGGTIDVFLVRLA